MKRIELLCTVLFIVAPFQDIAASFHFQGTIRDSSANPVRGAVVMLLQSGLTDTTDYNGNFTFPSSKNGTGKQVAQPKKMQNKIGYRESFSLLQQIDNSSIDIYNTRGKKILAILCSQFNSGQDAFRQINGALNSLNTSSVLLIVLRLRDKSYRFRLVKSATVSLPVQAVSSLSRTFWKPPRLTPHVPSRETMIVRVSNAVVLKKEVEIGSSARLNLVVDEIPLYYRQKANVFPDYYQQDPDFGGFPEDGAVYCGPTAASNALLWLADNGFPLLTNGSSDMKRDQHALITALGSSHYMNVMEGDGVGPDGVCKGLKKYIHDRGYFYDSLLCQGWRPVSSEFQSRLRKTDLSWIKRGILHKNVLLLNLGWYKYDARKDHYRRNGGHWVSLVGYGHDGKNVDPYCLIVHDPGSPNAFNEYRKIERITRGTMSGLRGMPPSAAGLYRFRTGKNSYGILDAAVMLSMPKIPTTREVSLLSASLYTKPARTE